MLLLFFYSEKTIDYEDELISEYSCPLTPTEMIGNLKVIESSENKFKNIDHLYAIVTLDGILMLAKREMILW